MSITPFLAPPDKPAEEEIFPAGLWAPPAERVGEFRMLRLPYGARPRAVAGAVTVSPAAVRDSDAKEAFDEAFGAVETDVGGVAPEDVLIAPTEVDDRVLYGMAFALCRPESLSLGVAMRYLAARLSPSCRAFVAFPDGEGLAAEKAASDAFGAERVWRAAPRRKAEDAPPGRREIMAALAKAEPIGATEHVVPEAALRGEIAAYLASGGGRGLSTGLADLDALYTVAPGELTVVTGYPNQGKSEFVDQLAVNLWRRDGYGTVFFSPENAVAEHALKIAEKIARCRRQDAGIAAGLDEAVRSFAWLRPPYPTIGCVLSQAAGLMASRKLSRLVIDPYNEIEQDRASSHESETEYVSRMLSEVKAFAKRRGAHVWFVAHPRKPEAAEKVKQDAPGLSAISGSQHWVNKADCGLAVARGEDGATKVFVRKIRNKRVGKLGECALNYDAETGTFSDFGPRYSHGE